MSARFVVQPSACTGGRVSVPGDKSISHRALMLGAVAAGRTHVAGFLPGEDCLATLAAVRAMGIEVTRHDATTVTIVGNGLRGLAAPVTPLDMGNSGTAMRLFTGLLAAQSFDSKLTGDASLLRRPMERVAEPLRRMGACIETSDGRPPLHIGGGRKLTGIDYRMPVASAQVKSAVLLAGLYAQGDTSVTESAVTRDHTERMLAAFGCEPVRSGSTVRVGGSCRLLAADITVPGDLSSAAFLMLAGCLSEAGSVVIENVGLNPTRTGIIDILKLMGADIEISPESTGSGAEPAGSIRVRPSGLCGVEIPPELVPLAIDEFPVIFMAAALAKGETRIRGAAELRHKESDRITAMVTGLRTLGIAAEELPDGARIEGGTLQAGTIDSCGDHRVAMSFAIGAARAAGAVTILDTANVRTSYPGFPGQAHSLGLDIEELA